MSDAELNTKFYTMLDSLRLAINKGGDYVATARDSFNAYIDARIEAKLGAKDAAIKCWKERAESPWGWVTTNMPRVPPFDKPRPNTDFHE